MKFALQAPLARREFASKLYFMERTAAARNYVVKTTRRRRRILQAGFHFISQAQLAEMKFALQAPQAEIYKGGRHGHSE